MKTKQTEEAFQWIINILNKNKIPFQIGGGFAVVIYGGAREVWDIDITLPTNKLIDLLPHVVKYITHELKEHHDENWIFTGMTVEYKGQEIDLVGAQGKKYLDNKTQTWITFENDFSTSEYREIFGLTVPVMAKERLLAYKKNLSREVDILDVQTLEEIK
jgi:hypothetical protein